VPADTRHPKGQPKALGPEDPAAAPAASGPGDWQGDVPPRHRGPARASASTP